MTPSVNERLGYGPEDKLLILHIDDIGVTHAANVTSFDALKKGIIASGSLMMPCSWAPEAVEMAKDHPEFDLGIHATITSERNLYRWGPITPAPSLRDRDGFFFRSNEEAIRHGTADDLEAELRAQIDRALALGLKPTHMDAHMYSVLMKRGFLEVYLKIAREYRLAPLILPGEDPGVGQAFLGEFAKEWTPAFSQRLRDDGFIVMDCCVNNVCGQTGKHVSSEERYAVYYESFKHCVPGLNYFFIHTAYDDDETRAAMGEKPARSRFFDYQAFTDERTREALDEAGVKLITFGPLQELFANRG